VVFVSVTRIAAHAGVSIATVSRVLNNSRRVKPEVAELVRAAMTELQLPARPPRRKGKAAETRRQTIAVVSLGAPSREWFQIPVMAAVVAEISRTAQEENMGVLMAEMPDPAQLAPALRHQPVDGAIVFVQSTLDPRIAAAVANRIPCVRIMGGQFAPVAMDHVAPDNNAVGYVAADYLASHGCQRLAFLTTQPQWDLSRLRAQGFAIAGLTLARPTASFVVSEDPGASLCYGPNAHARAALPELVAALAQHRPDGLFVSRDEELMNLYPLLRASGLEPGVDVRIISCDNENVRLSMLHPRPASIEIGTADIARRAVRRLKLRMRYPAEAPVRILITPHLIEPPTPLSPVSPPAPAE
jgi:DNA-binding LacI/PurR family transcriptional regulator